MTAPLSAAESFLTLLDDLTEAKAKPSGATAAVLLHHAAETLRDVLEVVDDLRRELKDVPADCGCGAQMEIVPVLGHRPGCDVTAANLAERPLPWILRTPDVPRPDGGEGRIAKPGLATMPGGPGPGHTDLPNLARHPDLECGAGDGEWLCNAVQGHAPLDHVTVVRGVVLTRWPSAPVADYPDDLTQVEITEEEHAEAVAYLTDKRGGIPPSLQRVIDMGGRIKGPIPRPPEDVRREGMGAQGEPATGPSPRANTLPPRTDVPRPGTEEQHPGAGGSIPPPGPGHLNGHAADPFRVPGICGICGDT